MKQPTQERTPDRNPDARSVRTGSLRPYNGFFQWDRQTRERNAPIVSPASARAAADLRNLPMLDRKVKNNSFFFVEHLSKVEVSHKIRGASVRRQDKRVREILK